MLWSSDGVWEWGYADPGRLISHSGPGGRERFAYDSTGQLVSKTGGAGEVTYFSYDALGRRVSEQGPDRTGYCQGQRVPPRNSTSSDASWELVSA